MDTSTDTTTDAMFTEVTKILIAMAQCLGDGPQEIDITKFSGLVGCNTTNTAQDNWRVFNKKLKELNPVEEGDETTPKGKGGKLKRKTSVKAAEESDEDREAPKKTVKGRGKKKAAEPVVESPSEGEKADINE